MAFLEFLPIIGKLLDKIIPDPVERERAKLELLKAQQAGDFRELDAAMEAITMEAASQHRLVALARPAFLYVIYIVILAGLPMGALYAFAPATAGAVSAGFAQWIHAIPDELWALFGAGYLGYAGARSYDKAKRLAAR